MGKKFLSGLVSSFKSYVDTHTPGILVGISVASTSTAIIFAVKATPKAMQLIKQRKKEIDSDNTNNVYISKTEIVKTCWKCYIPSAIMYSFSILCLICANAENVRRNAALATAYSLSETALKDYQEKVIETVGEKKEKIIKDKVAKSKIENHSENTAEIYITDKGDTLCYDVISGRYFKSDIDKIKKAVNEINKQLIEEGYISLNEFYYELGLDNIKLGEALGWNINKGGLIDINYSAQLKDDKEPCLVLDYLVVPKYNYY